MTPSDLCDCGHLEEDHEEGPFTGYTQGACKEKGCGCDGFTDTDDEGDGWDDDDEEEE
jgi:hypothetical protein